MKPAETEVTYIAWEWPGSDVMIGLESKMGGLEGLESKDKWIS
jgi:hypothetical protein